MEDFGPGPGTPQRAVLDACHKALTGRMLTEHQLATKLRGKGHAEELVEWAIERCHANRLLDDAAWARTFVRQRTARGHGPRRIRQDLAQRGVAPELVEAAFEELAESEEATDPIEPCVALLRKRFEPADLDDMKLRAKAFRLVISRGFESGDAERAIQLVRQER